MHTKKNIKIKNKTLAKIALTSVGCAIVGGGITEDHNLNNVKTQHLELVNNSKADINELFDVSNYVCPIIEQNYPTSSELMQSLIAFNPNYSNIDWDQLIVSYNGDGNAIVTAKENSLMYEGKKILPLATKIISTPTDCLLKEIGDTILISARLSGLWNGSYKWNYSIDSQLKSCLNILEDYNGQTIAFTLKKNYYGGVKSFDLSCTVLGIAQSNIVTINIQSDQIYIANNSILRNVADIVQIVYQIDDVDPTGWKYKCDNDSLTNYIKISSQINNLIFVLEKAWNFADTEIKVWYEKNGIKTNTVSFHIKSTQSYVFAQNSTLHLNVDADHGELKIDGASSIDSIGLHTHFKAMYLSYDLIDSNFSYLDGTKSMIQLMNENFIANVKLYTTMPTSEEFYVHYTWTYSSAGHPSKDLYHVWGGSWIENGSIICEERIFDIDHAGGQSGTKVYIQPKLDLNNVYPKWDFQNLSFSYTVNGNPFYCKNIMWGNDHSWVETPRIL